jgi:hypothetical protein
VNAFEQLADRQIAAPVKRRLARTTAEEATRKDNEKLLRRWHRWRQESLDAALASPDGHRIRALIEFLKTNPGDTALIDFVRSGRWDKAAVDARFLALRLIDDALIAAREQAGLPPLDDALPGEPATAFITIRELLR